jgi:hypothetical protein
MAVQHMTREITTVDDAKQRLRDIRDLGVTWLLGHIGPKGEPPYADQRNGYYRVPWTLAYVGEREAAAEVLSWIERSALTTEGDLVEGPAREPWITQWASYPLAIIAQGAWALERYDTAQAVMATLRTSFQDSKTGGAYQERPEARATHKQFLFPTAQLGLAGIMTGQADIADGAFHWFQDLLKAQPSLPQKLYTSWGPGGLVTDLGPEDRWKGLTDFRQPRQAFYNPGIGAAFLSRYFMISGDTSARQMALDLLKLSANGTEDQFNYWESMQICKFGWGSAMALEIDPSKQHVNNVLRMTQWYSNSQAPNGTWVPSGFLEPNPTDSDAMEKTAEHVLWVSMMLSSLAGGMDRGPIARH